MDKITATEAMQLAEHIKRESVFTKTVEGFTRKWGPVGDDYRLMEFSADLANLIRVTWADTQNYPQKQLESLMKMLAETHALSRLAMQTKGQTDDE